MTRKVAQSNNHLITEPALEQAARWFVDLQESQQTSFPPCRSDFNRWLLIEENQRAWQQINQIHQQYQRHQTQLNHQSASVLYDTVNISRRDLLKSVAGLSFATWLGWEGYHSKQMRHQLASLTADLSSAVGQSKQIALANNGQLWLNTNSAINRLSTTNGHAFELVTGEVYLDDFVTSSANAMVNHSNSTRLQTLINGKLLLLTTEPSNGSVANNSGARCTMMLNEDRSQCHLALYQGRATLYYQGQKRQLVADQQLQLAPNNAGALNFSTAQITLLNTNEKPPWLNGQLHANDIPLAEFVQQLKRYRSGYIRLQAGLENIRVAGVYPAFDSDATLDLLAKALPIRIHYLTPWFVSITS
ncbi:MAG: DUF4880 domain-containing protein [Gammaproteobacteria bacterium]|nr:DUF4880 domain-containing protein [Gammaproteobacteria bacterium]